MSYRKALVVDDSRVARVTLKKKLEQHGLAVDMAESAQEAIDYLHRNQPDIIFMDYLMPDVDGLEATRRIKADPSIRNVPVIICSGKEDEDYSERARSLGASDIIAKPPASDVLDAILRAPPAVLLEGPSAVAEALSARAAIVSAPPVLEHPTAAAIPAMDEAALRTLLDELIAPRLQSQREEVLKELHDIQHHVMEEIVTSFEQRLSGIQQRLDELAAAEPAPRAPDMGEIFTALEERLTRQSVELQQQLQAQLQSQSPVPLVEQMDERLRAQMQAQRTQLTESLDQWAERFSGMAERIARLSDTSTAAAAANDNRFDALQRRLNTVETTQAATPARDIDAAFSAFEDKVNLRLAELQDLLKEQLEEQSPIPLVAELDERLRTGLQGQQERIQQSTDQWAGRFDAFAKDVGKLSDALSTSKTGHDERLKVLQERLVALESAAPAPVVDAILAAAEKKFEQRTTELQSRFQAQLEGQSPVLSRIQTQLDEQGKRIKESSEQWGRRVDSLVDDVSVLSDAVSSSDVAHERRFNALQQRLLALEGAAPEPVVDAILAAADDKFAQRFNALQQGLDALENAAPAPVVDAILAAADDKFAQRFSTLQQGLVALENAAPAPVVDAILTAAEDRFRQRFSTLQQGLVALENAAPAPVVDAILAAAEEKFAQRISDLQTNFESRLESQAPAPLVDRLREDLQNRLHEQYRELATTLAERTQQLETLVEETDRLAELGNKAQATNDRQIGALRERLDTLAKSELPSIQSAIASMEEKLSQRMTELQATLPERMQDLHDVQRSELNETLERWSEQFDALKEDNRAVLASDADRFEDAMHEELERRVMQVRSDLASELQLQFSHQLRRLQPAGAEEVEDTRELSALLAQAEKRSGELLPQIDRSLTELRDQLKAQQTMTAEQLKTQQGLLAEQLKTQQAAVADQVKMQQAALADQLKLQQGLMEEQSRRLLAEAESRARPVDSGLADKINRLTLFGGIGVAVSLGLAVLAYLR